LHTDGSSVGFVGTWVGTIQGLYQLVYTTTSGRNRLCKQGDTRLHSEETNIREERIQFDVSRQNAGSKEVGNIETNIYIINVINKKLMHTFFYGWAENAML